MSGVCLSVGVKLRRRAVMQPQDGERAGVKATKNHRFVFHRRFLRDLWPVVSNTLAKNLHLRCAVAAAADPRQVCERRGIGDAILLCVWADGTGECSMLGVRSSGVMVMKWSN
jgi:hypothetical protein